MRRLLSVLALAAVLTLPGLPGRADAEPGPPAEATALTGVRTVITSSEHSCALLQNGQVRCWGSNDYGMIGSGTFDPAPAPTTVVAVSGSGPLTGVTQLAAGSHHTCALLTNHQVRCWGFNDSGQLATNTGYTSFNRPKVALNETGTGPLRNVIAISAGGENTCALLANHQLRCWGTNSDGELGDGTLSNTSELPRPVLQTTGTSRLSNVTQVSVGYFHVCARLSNGQARCWGYNDKGQVGDGASQFTRRRPQVVRSVSGPGALTGVREVSAGDKTSCAVLNNGQVRCWGMNEDGGLGNGQLTNRRRPVRVVTGPNAPLTGIAHVEAGYSSACAQTTNNRVRCWGYGLHGGMGNGIFHEDNINPITVRNPANTAPLTGLTQLSYRSGHACVRLANGQVRCWGGNISGQLGDGTGTDQPLPVVVGS